MADRPRPLALRDIPQPRRTPSPPHPHHTPSPGGASRNHDLRARQVTLTPATCGYYSGIATSPVTCDTNTGYECGFLPDATAPNFGCCSTAPGGTTCELGYVSTCLENGASGNYYSGAGVALDTEEKLFMCGTDTPYCSTLILYGTGDTSYYSYACQTGSGTTATAYIAAETTSDSSSSSSPDGVTSAAPQSSGARTTSAMQQSATVAAASGGLSKGSKIGIGVGVGIGAIVLALLVALLVFWMRKRRSNTASLPGYAHPPQMRQEMDDSPWRDHAGSRIPADVHEHCKPHFSGPDAHASELMGPEPAELSSLHSPR